MAIVHGIAPGEGQYGLFVSDVHLGSKGSKGEANQTHTSAQLQAAEPNVAVQWLLREIGCEGERAVPEDGTHAHAPRRDAARLEGGGWVV